jgi:hypothetical protein
VVLRTRSKIVSAGAAISLIITLLGTSAAAAVPIVPDPEPAAVTAVASLQKDASVTTVAPGDTFTYTLTVGCSSITDLGCRDAVLSDTVPAPFVVVDAVVGAGVNTALEPVISGNTVTVTWTTDLDGPGDDGIGILDATTAIVEITAQLPAGASFDASGVEVFNEAWIEGTNFVDVPASAGVTPQVPLELATTPTKTLSPTGAVAAVGTPVTTQLGGSNDSNATVDALVIQDPGDPDAAPNPFAYLGFSGFGAVTAPAGTTTTTYEVYVPPTWIEAAGGVLPDSIDPAAVRGIRVTFAGAIPAGATAAVPLDLALTDLAGSQPDGTVVTNTVSSEVVLGDDTARAETSADFTLQANDIVVTAGKSFDPDVVVAGQPSTVELSAANASTIALESLTIREPSTGDFPDAYSFDGFTDGIDYPADATSAQVVYSLAGGGTEAVPFADGALPAAPAAGAGAVTSFEVVFTGPIEPGGETAVQFRVETDPTLGETADLPITVPNEVAVIGANQGATGEASATDDLHVYDEVIEPYIGKTVRPSQILAVPGQVVTVSLQGGLTERPNPPDTTTGSTGNADVIVIQDPQSPIFGDPWWNAFDLTAIAQTPVPGEASLTIEYYDVTDGLWKVLAADIEGETIYSAPVPTEISAVAGGIRFTYTYTGDDGLGFPPGTDLAPNFTSELRPIGRYTEPNPPYSDDTSTFVPNCAESSAGATTPGVPTGSATMTPADCPEIELIPTDPGNADLVDKAFGTSSSGGVKSVIARSGDTIPSTLSWSTGGYSGFERVEITDVADPQTTAIADSVFDAFTLTRVQPITAATDPYIVYDQVQEVLLWNGSAWVGATNDPCPAGCIGQFPGMSLTAGERLSTTGVRLVFVESPDRAEASIGDPAAPPVGSGVSRSFGNDRDITLTWQVRDERRSDGEPVLGDIEYNVVDPGVVGNTVQAQGYPADGDPVTSTDADEVVIIDVPLTTTTDKNWEGGPLAVPTQPDIPVTSYPLSRITVTTRNTTPAKVDQLLIADPAPGSNTDRRTDPFEGFTFNNFSRIDEPAGTTSTVVRLFCPDGQAPVDYTRAQALALTPAALPCDVTGLQIAFDGRIAANAAGVVAFDVRLRPYWRGTTERVSVADSPLSNTAQGVVADIDPVGTCPPPEGARFACDQATAVIRLEDPSFSVDAAKSIVPADQKPGQDGPVTVTLTAQPGGTARTRFLTITDDDPTFWNAFDFAGMASSWTLPVPVGRVQACYLAGGDFSAANVAAGTVGGSWTCQPIQSSMPVADAVAFLEAAPDDLHGLRFSFAQANELGWQNPARPVVNVPVLMERRVDLRSGGPVPTTRADQTAAPGEADAGIFWNTVKVDSVSTDVGIGPLEAAAIADAEYRYLHLEAAVSVNKSPSGDIRPGAVIPFSLTFRNTGEAPLTDPVFSDELPTDAQGRMLIFDPDADPTVSPYTFALAGAAPTPPNGTPLPTDPDEIDIEEVGDSLVFTMPAGSVLEPGQTYTITIRLMLRPGLPAGTPVQNWAVVDVVEPLDECVPTYDEATGACRDDAIVRPLSVPAISTVKRVKADVAHGEAGIPEVFSLVEGYDCATAADANGFFRYPCVPVTLPGGTETWRFTVTNAGTLPLDTVVSIDNLPTPGDQGLIVQLPRESAWEPTFAGDIELLLSPTAPAAAQVRVFYSTSSVPCTADLNPLGTPCATGAWLPLDDTVDPALVRSIKFVIDFPTGDLLLPGETLDLLFRTRTTPSEALDPDFPIAFNTVATGGSAVGTTPTVVPATEGRRVGVSYPTGPIALRKIVSGPAADLAPGEFPVQLECTVEGVPVGGIDEVVLVPGADPTSVEGLPWGAECTATEGQWGQTETLIGTAVVGGPEDEIGLVTVENVFDVADLTIRKSVLSDAEDQRGGSIDYGPFSFAVSCTFLGEEVWATGYDAGTPMAEELTPDQVWALGGLPVGAECVVTETDDLGALETSMVVTDAGGTGEPIPGAEATVVIDETVGVQVTAVNTFGSGPLLLEKQTAGDAAEDFGQGPFDLAVACVLDTGDGPRSVWTGFVEIEPGETVRIDDIALGAQCTVRETDDGGATDVEIEGSPATIVADGAEVAAVTITNTFDAGSLIVTKEIEGDGAELWGAGPFEVTLACVDPFGDPVELVEPVRELSEGNQYTTTYAPLLVGLECTLTETGTGGATATTITDADGQDVEVIEIPQAEVEVTVTNTFDLGSIEVVKTLSGDGAGDRESDLFEVTASCTWNGEPIEVPAGDSATLAVDTPAVFEDLPVGAECAITETDTGGAAAVTYTPADPSDGSRALVVVGADAAASVTIDNRFDADLAPTGFDARSAWLAAMIAILLVGGGAALVLRRRSLRP